MYQNQVLIVWYVVYFKSYDNYQVLSKNPKWQQKGPGNISSWEHQNALSAHPGDSKNVC